MRAALFFAVIFFCNTHFSFSQQTLTIEIGNLRNYKGQVHIELSNDKEVSLMIKSQNIIGDKCVIVFDNLALGRYAFRFFHDENLNKKIDLNWMGIPREGFGFSNNPVLIFGPPAFGKTVFDFTETKVIKCKPRYFL